MKTTINPGSPIDTLTRDELRGELDRTAQEWFRQYARGVKYMRFGPLSVVPDGSGDVDTSGSASNPGPREGFMWSIKRLAIAGLASGDTITVWRGNTYGVPVWIFTDTTSIATFGKMDLALNPGESLVLTGTGLTSTQLYMAGDILECAAEELIKLV